MLLREFLYKSVSEIDLGLVQMHLVRSVTR